MNKKIYTFYNNKTNIIKNIKLKYIIIYYFKYLSIRFFNIKILLNYFL